MMTWRLVDEANKLKQLEIRVKALERLFDGLAKDVGALRTSQERRAYLEQHGYDGHPSRRANRDDDAEPPVVGDKDGLVHAEITIRFKSASPLIDTNSMANYWGEGMPISLTDLVKWFDDEHELFSIIDTTRGTYEIVDVKEVDGDAGSAL